MPTGNEYINIHAYVNLCILTINVPVTVHVSPQKYVKIFQIHYIYAACKHGVPVDKE